MNGETLQPKRHLTFVERVLNVTESRVKYLTKPNKIDFFLAKTFLRFIPASVTPNQMTLFRFATIPFVIVLLLTKLYLLATILFSISAFSDALDGARARTTGHITSWGILADPLADKLLIGLTAIILVSQFIGIWLAFLIIFLELALVFSAYHRYRGKVVPAKVTGKIKMILQSFGLGFLLLFVMIGNPVLLLIATYLLYSAVLFALLSLFVYRSV